MKKKKMLLSSAAAVAVAVLVSAMPGDEVITKDSGKTVVNTTTLTTNVRGFKGTTPVKIYISKNKIVKIEPLRNRETPQYFDKAKKLLEKYEGKSVTKAQETKVDAVSGATFSSKALIKNVQSGLDYYKEHK
ncbi:MAG: FMN-binding protein [Prevotella sp.]|jgi:hypothetical protein|nr:FMN-binding protein [Prevotella sp.]